LYDVAVMWEVLPVATLLVVTRIDWLVNGAEHGYRMHATNEL
jgi:hypothetical protein